MAWYYYKTGLTQEEIGRRLGLTRARVIKLLEKSRKQGIISIYVNSRYSNCLELEARLKARWGLKDAVIIPEVDPGEINENLGAAGA